MLCSSLHVTLQVIISRDNQRRAWLLENQSFFALVSHVVQQCSCNNTKGRYLVVCCGNQDMVVTATNAKIPIRASEKDNTIIRNGALSVAVGDGYTYIDCISKIHVEENGKPRMRHLAWYFGCNACVLLIIANALLNFYIMKCTYIRIFAPQTLCFRDPLLCLAPPLRKS